MTNKKKKILLSIIGGLLVLTLSVTYGYFGGTFGPGANTDISLEASRVEKLIFDKGDAISLKLNQNTLTEGGVSLSGESTATATLVASETTNNSSANYNVYFNIDKNEFVYTTSDSKPEIIAEITNVDGNKVTSITGLSYVTATDNQGTTVTGFDITNKTGRFDVKLDEAISSTDSVTGVTESWKVKVTFINLDTNQAANAGKVMNAEFVLSQRENVILNQIMSPSEFADTIASVTGYSAPLIDELRFSNVKSNDYYSATQKWDVSENADSEEVIAYIEDHATDGKILHVQSNGDVVFYEKMGVYNKNYFKNIKEIDLSQNIDLSRVTNMSYMFQYSEATSVNLDNVDTSNVINMNYMFHSSNTDAFDFTKLSTNKVISMIEMFYLSTGTNSIHLSNFDLSNVIDISGMFGNTNLDKFIFDSFNSIKVTDVGSLFMDSKGTKIIDTSVLNFDNAIDMSYMFFGANLDIFNFTNFNTSSATDMSYMFCESEGNNIINFSSFNLSNVLDMRAMFARTNLSKFNFDVFNANNATDMSWMFSNSFGYNMINFSNFDSSNVEDMNHMFTDSNIHIFELSNLNTSKAKNMSYMFSQNSIVNDLDLSNLDTSNVSNMNYMFSNTIISAELNLSNIDASKVTEMKYMFSNVTVNDVVKLNYINNVNLNDVEGIFKNVDGTGNIDLSGFLIGSAIINSAFSNSNLDLFDFTQLDTSEVVVAFDVFANSYATSIDLSSFDFSSLIFSGGIFEGLVVETIDISNIYFNFDSGNGVYVTDMFKNTTASTIILRPNTFGNTGYHMSGMFENVAADTIDIRGFDDVYDYDHSMLVPRSTNVFVGCTSTIIVNSEEQKEWYQTIGGGTLATFVVDPLP